MIHRRTVLATAMAIVIAMVAMGTPAGAAPCITPGEFPVGGTVTDALTGAPFGSDVSVSILYPDGDPYDGDVTRADGTFESCVPEGSWLFGFSADRHFGEWWDDAATIADASVIDVFGPVTGIDAALTPFPVITGRLSDARTGAPLTSTSVSLVDAGSGTPLDGEGTDASGVYSFVIDPSFYSVPGTYKISFSADDYWSEWYSATKKRVKKRSKATVITVTRESGVIGGIDGELRRCRTTEPRFCIPNNFLN